MFLPSITQLLRWVGRWALLNLVNHTNWVAVVTPTDRPKSVCNRCVIELFCGVVCVVTLPFWHFYWCRGYCHRTGSDLFLFLSVYWNCGCWYSDFKLVCLTAKRSLFVFVFIQYRFTFWQGTPYKSNGVYLYLQFIYACWVHHNLDLICKKLDSLWEKKTIKV